jgi:hypothetical protein
LTGARQLPADLVAANVDYLKRMVQVEAKPLTTASVSKAAKPPGVSAGEREPARQESAAGDAPAGWVTKVAQVKPEA